MNVEAAKYALAQANIGRIVAPLDDPVMAGFVDQLDFINALADHSPGFLWRLQTEDGDATAVRPFEDERILVNMSVWESLEALYEYVYRSEHLEVLRGRRQWFERMDGPHLVLWWVPAGHRPTVAEAKERLDILAGRGPCPEAFTFKRPFSPLGVPLGSTSKADWMFCDA